MKTQREKLEDAAVTVAASLHQDAAEIRRQLTLRPRSAADVRRIAELSAHLAERNTQLANLLARLAKLHPEVPHAPTRTQ